MKAGEGLRGNNERGRKRRKRQLHGRMQEKRFWKEEEERGCLVDEKGKVERELKQSGEETRLRKKNTQMFLNAANLHPNK